MLRTLVMRPWGNSKDGCGIDGSMVCVCVCVCVYIWCVWYVYVNGMFVVRICV